MINQKIVRPMPLERGLPANALTRCGWINASLNARASLAPTG
jgi:hypothetical protein